MSVGQVLRSVSRKRAPQRLVPRIRVRGSFQPDVLTLAAGEPIQIDFCREETAGCSERVVFPEFGRSATLLPFKDVRIELPAAPPGEYEFTCQFGLLRGRLLVVAESGYERRSQ